VGDSAFNSVQKNNSSKNGIFKMAVPAPYLGVATGVYEVYRVEKREDVLN
jgi:hypothetical protein